MMYKGKNDNLTRQLRRLFEVEIYNGDPDDPKVTTRKETIIAWNATDANRRTGRLRLKSRAVAIGWITWDDEPLFIESPQKGPTKKKAKPTLGKKDEWE